MVSRTAACTILSMLWRLSLCQNTTQQTYQEIGTPPCDALIQAGLGARLLLPSDDAYEDSMAGYYSLNAQKRPWCILQPRETEDVSLAIAALNLAGSRGDIGGVAIRSGGHSSAAEASGIVNGVTIDLGLMNHTSYDISTGVASIEPGARWQYVYAALSPNNVTVSGGRDGDVGAGGLLLGGGISYYASRTGFSADSVTNFEVVLANGTIVNANQNHCPDLWRALKGGTNNFGVVTRFDMTTLPGQELAYSQRFISPDHFDTFVDAIVQFTEVNNDAPDDAVIAFYTHQAGISGMSIVLIEVNTRGHANSTTFDRFNSIPANISVDTVWSLASAAQKSQYPGGPRSAGSTLTFRNDARVIRRGVELHEEFVASLSERIGADNFTTTCFFEPIPSSVERLGRESGGNVLGLPRDEDLIVWDAGFLVTTNDADFAVAHAALRQWSVEFKDYARSIQADVDFEYANYADAAQDVIGSYSAENVEFMREVARKYDPSGFFQTRVPGGFKVW